MDKEGNRTISLDKNHGFMKFIIKNQLERDIFDKEQRQKEYQRSKEDQLLSKEELTVEALKKFSQLSLSSSQNTQAEPLFNLEFLTKHGNIVQVKVNQYDSAEFVVESVVEQYPLKDQIKGALFRRVEEEIEKRRTQGK